MAFFGAFASLGFNDIQITNMVESPEETGGIVGTALVLRLVASTISVAGIARAGEVAPIAPGAYPVGCTDIEQDFSRVGAGETAAGLRVADPAAFAGLLDALADARASAQ